jgi:hypothetical protein
MKLAPVPEEDSLGVMRWRASLLSLSCLAASGWGCAAGGETPAVVDTTAPVVVASIPAEGQGDVSPELAVLVVTFDERMDTSAVLEGGAALWSTDAVTLELTLAGPLEYATPYRIDLRALRDVAGNAIDGAPQLVDGFLDFTTAGEADAERPHVIASDPAEGAIDHDPLLQAITVAFSEAMDPTLTQVPFTEDGQPLESVGGTWSEDDTVLTVSFGDYLTAGATFHLDLRGLTDRAGNPLDAAHAYLVDGVLDFALAKPGGDDCDDPLVASQADVGNGFHTWYLPPGLATGRNGAFACDPDGSGPDAVIEYIKSTGTLAEGGELLHVIATAQNAGINLEITSGDCVAARGAVEKCLWLKGSWDAFLDVPAGRYWIWVSEQSATAGATPGATVSVEEIPATASQAEGEGCFAPYTTSSTNYTPPLGAGDPHVWELPFWINGFDIAPSTGAPGTIDCGVDPAVGIQGVDAVIELQKAPATNTLLVELDHLGAFSELDVEVLGGCDATEAATVSHYCRAYVDSYPDGFAFTVAPPDGPTYLWIGASRTYQEFVDTEVKITELTLAAGEARSLPEPIASSGPIHPTSTVGLERPTCFSPSLAVHWYSYTASGTLFGVRSDAAAPLAVIGPDGNEAACSTDASTVAIGDRVAVGSPVLIAVESPTAIGHLELIDEAYTGVGDMVTDLGVTFPVDPDTDSMAVGSDEIFLGSSQAIWSLPKAGSAVAVEHAGAEGLGPPQLGSDIHFVDGKLFSVDTTSSTSNHRLWAVYDELDQVWSPVPWDEPSGYPPSTPVYAMARDGTHLVLASGEAGGVQFFDVDATTAPATPLALGANPGVQQVGSLALDATYFYVAGRDSAAAEGIYRIARADIAAPALLLSPYPGRMAVDDATSANHLYVREYDALHVIVHPGGPTPISLEALSSLGGGYSMAMDPATTTLYLFDSYLPPYGGLIALQ